MARWGILGVSESDGFVSGEYLPAHASDTTTDTDPITMGNNGMGQNEGFHS
jgi:hypothetical protein